MNTDKVINQLLQQEAIDKYTEYLVNEAEDTISDELMDKLPRTMKNQFSNLLSVTMTTNSPAAVVNWIRYQMGRMQETWKNTELGGDILRRIEKMEQLAKKIGTQLYGEEVQAEQIAEIQMILIRQYSGYMRRWFIGKGE